MLDLETTMERAFREEGALLALTEAYRKGNVLNATRKDAEDFFQRAAAELSRIHKVINSPTAIEEQLKSSQRGFSRPFSYPVRLLDAHILSTQKKAA